MKREHELRDRLRSLEALGAAVTAMKSLSAHHFREARAGLEPARRYRDGIDRVVAQIGASLPAGDGPGGLLVVGSELGLCGAYNAHLVAAAAHRRAELGRGPTLCVGRRAATYLARRDVGVDRAYAAPASLQGITDLLLRLTEDMLSTYVTTRLSCFEVVSSHFEGVGVDRPTITRLLPFGTARVGVTAAARYAGSGTFLAVRFGSSCTSRCTASCWKPWPRSTAPGSWPPSPPRGGSTSVRSAFAGSSRRPVARRAPRRRSRSPAGLGRDRGWSGPRRLR